MIKTIVVSTCKNRNNSDNLVSFSSKKELSERLKNTKISLSDHEGILEVRIHSFLTAVLEEGECSTSRPDRFVPGKEAGTS
jgi:hypothetical protein